jgi:hypothetical protein
MSTNIFVKYLDLLNIFEPYESGNKASNTNILVNNNDLANIFAPYESGTKASNTNILVNNNDLANIFKKTTTTTITRFNIAFTTNTYNVYVGYVNSLIYAIGKVINPTYNNVTTTFGSASITIVAVWNPRTTTWGLIGTFVGTASLVQTIIVPGDNSFYIAGALTQLTLPNGTTLNVNRIAKYNTTTGVWSTIPNNTANIFQIIQLGIYGDVLYSINQIGGPGFYYTNNSWNTIPGEIYVNNTGGLASGQCFAIDPDTGIYYMGGNFVYANDTINGLQIYNYLLKYDPLEGKISRVPNSNNTTNNTKFGVVTPTGFNAMIVVNRILYVAANANISGGNTRLNAYNTITNVWTSPTSGITTGAIRTFHYYDGVLYMGGNFTQFVGGSARVVAWNIEKNTWTSLTLDATFGQQITSIAYDPDLRTTYVGTASGTPGITTG